MIHNTTYMLSGEKMASRLKHPANFPTLPTLGTKIFPTAQHSCAPWEVLFLLWEISTLFKPNLTDSWIGCSQLVDIAHMWWDPLKSTFMMEKNWILDLIVLTFRVYLLLFKFYLATRFRYPIFVQFRISQSSRMNIIRFIYNHSFLEFLEEMELE